MSTPKKIKDNPSFAEISNQMKAMEALYKISPLLRIFSPKINKAFESFPEIKNQAKIFEVPDRFNERFAELGWIAYESMNLDVMKEAIDRYDTEGVDVAEQFLADSYDADCLCWDYVDFKVIRNLNVVSALLNLQKKII